MSKIQELLYKLVSVQSDTGTKLEVDMAEYLFDIVKEQAYFQEHPQLCGMYYGDDFLKRPIVWALRKGKSQNTIILTGHYDAVGLEPYGTVKAYALKPEELKEKLKDLELSPEIKADLENSDWHFGRGINDMKAGLSINLNAIDSIEDAEANILFMAVHDEENLSAGMRQGTKLLVELSEKHHLDYKLMVITEPHTRSADDRFKMFTGTVGKIMPLIVAKGKTTHISDVMNGLNATLITSRIVTELELNPELCSSDLGMMTTPPTVLYARDLKGSYDVSMPEYSAFYLSFSFLKSKTAEQILGEIKTTAQGAFRKVIEKYQAAQRYLDEKGVEQTGSKQDFEPLVYTFEELQEIAKKNNPRYGEESHQLYEEVSAQVQSGELTIQDAGIQIVKRVIQLSQITEPLVVVGVIPPYYPPANNSYLAQGSERFEECLETILTKKYGLKVDKEAYFMGISDGSYTCCANRAAEQKIMASMVTSENMYHIPFEYMEKLSVPFLILGPWGKDYHTISERVYMPDVEKTLPELIQNLVYMV
ncbi:M20/M25/M40 family metallo-hydrolase [Aminipila luticellarii]|uniref:M20/M25/M40 family metallo-hydrolase n=1 Tax=Aminipila luticellarii TaxID=2507160 RepID=A0A410PTW0_9FIRM|nr:M20/M25/M40 family metallo-hydrolase [Aminipila luticellarii]QAT42340.1 M20/M25/M40 family metallo-hydrolase [Aminipila luticellarii]